MITYFGEPGRAGFNGDKYSSARAKLNQLWQKRLYSYFYLASGQSKMVRKQKNKVELFLDSGAFSAWSQKKEIDIFEYIKFIKKHEKLISVYANLDDITSPQRTWKNQLIMEKAGLNPIPVFHYGEDIKYLERLLKAEYPYISLGGMVPISTNVLVQWLDRIFGQFLTDKKGMPLVKVHGFGLTSLRLMLRYPWYSVDSTSWVVTGRMGAIYIPKWKGGKWIYDEDSWKVIVSNRSPNRNEKGKHINTMKAIEKKILLRYIEEKGYKLGESHSVLVSQDHELKENERWIDKKPKDSSAKRLLEVIDIEGVSNRYQLRDEMNILYFLDLEKSMRSWPWAFTKNDNQKGFFD